MTTVVVSFDSAGIIPVGPEVLRDQRSVEGGARKLAVTVVCRGHLKLLATQV